MIKRKDGLNRAGTFHFGQPQLSERLSTTMVNPFLAQSNAE